MIIYGLSISLASVIIVVNAIAREDGLTGPFVLVECSLIPFFATVFGVLLLTRVPNPNTHSERVSGHATISKSTEHESCERPPGP